MRYKCNTCLTIFGDEHLEGDLKCPLCGEVHIEKMCKLDHLCTCSREVSYGVHYCPECGQPICPCGCHDVEQISRVTGYLQDVSGWNAAKQQELKDRNRYDKVDI